MLCVPATPSTAENERAEFVDQPVFEEGAIDAAATFQKQLLHAEGRADAFHRAGQIIALGTRKHIGHAVRAQF